MSTSAVMRRPAGLAVLAALVLALAACSSPSARYLRVEENLRAGNYTGADQVIEHAEKEYGAKSRVLYWMDRGMTLHLAGRYQESTAMLEQAESKVERLYTRRIRTETKAFLTNDTALPYEGEPYEHVMINVIKALNYAVSGGWEDALVEARRVDHRLNVLADQTPDRKDYRDDAYARYLCGMLYEGAGDLNNAFIAYRRAYDAYLTNRPWAKTPVPSALRGDLLRVTDALHLNQEHEEYRREFGETAWKPVSETRAFAHLVVISYNGRAPRKEDQFIDLPISLDALKLVLLTRGVLDTRNPETRIAESALYGLSGRVVRVALPKVVPQKTAVASEQVTLDGAGGEITGTSELAQDFTALAEKSLAERITGIAMKAVARAAVKFAMAEGAQYGARVAAGRDAGPWVGLIVGILAKTAAALSEEADKRSWQTLPDEIQITRLWIPPGEYDIRVRAIGRAGEAEGRPLTKRVSLASGETTFLIQRVVP